MEKVTMTVHQALCEVKVADKRVSDAIISASFVGERKNSSTQVKGIPVDDYNKQAIASWQSVNDIINRTDEIKKALSKSNPETMITVAGKQMSVAEAIYAQQHGCDKKELLLYALRDQYNKAVAKIVAENGDKLEQRLDRYIAENYGSKDTVKNDMIEEASKKFREQNTFVLCDPLGIADKMAQLQKDIDTFKAEVDSALQTSNATTEITIEY